MYRVYQVGLGAEPPNLVQTSRILSKNAIVRLKLSKSLRNFAAHLLKNMRMTRISYCDRVGRWAKPPDASGF